MDRTIAMIMAGGRGARLGPITAHRAKPATPFGGRYRIIDFALSNFVNSGYRQIYVLTQYMASSLIRHINATWYFGGGAEFVEVVPAQMRMGSHWYRGTADSIFQNLNLIRDARPGHVAVFGGDHIYRFAVDQMEAAHRSRRADLTIAAYRVPRAEAHSFGVIQVDARGRVVGFQEKPADPTPIPGSPDVCLVSMGNYFFRTAILEDALIADARDPSSDHDFGKDVIQSLVRQGAEVYIYDFSVNQIPGDHDETQPYWRDVGTLDSYFGANMDLLARRPPLNLYNRAWPIRTARRDDPPARFVHQAAGPAGEGVDCIAGEGSVIDNAFLRRSILSGDCLIGSGCRLDQVLLMSGGQVGPGAQIRRAILDKNCRVAPTARIGLDPVVDRERFPFLTAEGLVVLPKGTWVPARGPIELAYDVAALLEDDPLTRDRMAAFAGRYVVSNRDRHSFPSAGPRRSDAWSAVVGG